MPQARRLPRIVRLGGERPALMGYGAAAAAVIVVALVASSVLGGFGVGRQPPPPLIREGDLRPGTYVAHPLPPPDDGLTVTLTVPEGWSALGSSGLVPRGEPGTRPPGGMSIQFIDVTTLNDPCSWSGSSDDVTVGPGVADLAEALASQTAYDVSDPVDVTLGGHAGTRVDLVIPSEPFAGQTESAPGCDDGRFRLWNTSAHGEGWIYAQGPGNRWETYILAVDGTRLLVVVSDFPGTLPADRAELDAIVDSLVIRP